MPLHYISLNLFEKCLYFQSTFILYYGSSKIENFDLATKTEIMIIGLTTSCEIIQIEITNSRKYMKELNILPMISFIVCVLSIFQYGHFSFSIWRYFSNTIRTTFWQRLSTVMVRIIRIDKYIISVNI